MWRSNRRIQMRYVRRRGNGTWRKAWMRRGSLHAKMCKLQRGWRALRMRIGDIILMKTQKTPWSLSWCFTFFDFIHPSCLRNCLKSPYSTATSEIRLQTLCFSSHYYKSSASSKLIVFARISEVSLRKRLFRQFLTRMRSIAFSIPLGILPHRCSFST